MKTKTFFVLSLITVAVISLATSLLTVSFLQKPILGGPQQEITVQTSPITSSVNVIIIDPTVIVGISDTIDFGTVQSGTTYSTVNPSAGAAGPKPFVIRNDGNIKASVDVYATETQLFQSSLSSLQFWTVDIYNDIGSFLDAPYNVLDNCFGGAGACSAASTCTPSSPCTMPFDVDGPGGPTPGDAPLRAINSLEFSNSHDNVFMHIRINVGADEPTGIKTTKIVVVGSQA